MTAATPETDAGRPSSRVRRWVAAVRGAIGFLSVLPVGHDEHSFEAFRRTPASFPAAGYLLGLAFAVPIAVSPPLPHAVGAAGFLAVVVLVAGVNNADGLADLGDAWAVHGSREDRVSAMKDTTLGVGGTLALATGVVALALGGFGLAGLAWRAAGVVVAAEVGAKLGLAALACFGEARHEGLGSTMTTDNRPRDLGAPVLLALPVGVLTWPHPAAFAVLAGAVATVLVVRRWANANLGGISGDVFGAANELGRIAGIHVGLTVLLVF